MIQALLLLVIGAMLILMGIMERGRFWIAAWPGVNFLVLGIGNRHKARQLSDQGEHTPQSLPRPHT